MEESVSEVTAEIAASAEKPILCALCGLGG
jgi:hypothetical protein